MYGYENLWSFGLALSSCRQERERARLANMTIDEVEAEWVQKRLRRLHSKVSRNIEQLAKITGPWRHAHGYRQNRKQSGSLKKLLRKAK